MHVQLVRTSMGLVCCFALATGLHAAPQSAPGWTSQELAKLVASDGAGGDSFGVAISVDGDTAIVGTDQASGSPDAEVYVLRHNSLTGVWDEVASLIPSDPTSIDDFGSTVSLSGDTAVVGAPGPEITSPGAATRTL